MEIKKSETLKYHYGMAEETTSKMREVRKKFYDLAVYLESIGVSRELSIAFTNIQEAQMYTILHLCLTDTAAKVEDLE